MTQETLNEKFSWYKMLLGKNGKLEKIMCIREYVGCV